MPGPTDSTLLARAATGDDAAFAALVGPHQRAVFRHCYRMLGSGADAEDATQDTLERAWRRLATYDGSGPFGAWLQRIATNICLDGLRARRTRIGPASYGPPMAPGTMPGPPDPELAWVEPVSDSDLRGTGDPQDEVVRREEISLAFVAALQRLAPRQRAALLLHDVLAFSHVEVGEVLGVSTTAVNSLLSRARESVRATAGRPQPGISEPRVRQLLERYVRAWQLADIEGFVQLIAEDVRFSMPPLTAWFDGREAVATFIENAVFAPARPHGIHLKAGWCNGQPAFATYEPDDQGRLVASGLQVLQLADVDSQPLITALVSYRNPALAIRCGLPAILS
ncbi:MAG TPA: RNA polymerase subunit sigma-70 [Streptosporangiaceae bacterium]|nr:RNA polymerase subunit sigma-70 [Streptosporangiaceae bacterium]